MVQRKVLTGQAELAIDHAEEAHTSESLAPARNDARWPLSSAT
jgi:hypothetical protein